VIKSERKLKQLADILQRGNILYITEAIKSLREEEPFEGAIGLLVAFYNETSDKSGLRIIEDFLNDMKDQSVRAEVVAEIRKPWKANTISMLVSSCWQSGLDYSDYIADMAKIFLEGDYATAVECMTVMEESVKESSREKKDEIIRIVEESPLSFTNEKSALTKELILILKG
jgi:predicted DNA-binding protein